MPTSAPSRRSRFALPAATAALLATAAVACSSVGDDRAPSDPSAVTVPEARFGAALHSAGGYLWWTDAQRTRIYGPTPECDTALCHVATHKVADVTFDDDVVLVGGATPIWAEAARFAVEGPDAGVDLTRVAGLEVDAVDDTMVTAERLWFLEAETATVRSVARADLDAAPGGSEPLEAEAWPVRGLQSGETEPRFAGGHDAVWITQGSRLWRIDPTAEPIVEQRPNHGVGRDAQLSWHGDLYASPLSGGLVRFGADHEPESLTARGSFKLAHAGDHLWAFAVDAPGHPDDRPLAHRLDEDGLHDGFELDLPAGHQARRLMLSGGVFVETVDTDGARSVIAFDPRTLEPIQRVGIEADDQERAVRATWHRDQLALLHYQDLRAHDERDPAPAVPGDNRLVLHP